MKHIKNNKTSGTHFSVTSQHCQPLGHQHYYHGYMYKLAGNSRSFTSLPRSVYDHILFIRFLIFHLFLIRVLHMTVIRCVRLKFVTDSLPYTKYQVRKVVVYPENNNLAYQVWVCKVVVQHRTKIVETTMMSTLTAPERLIMERVIELN